MSVNRAEVYADHIFACPNSCNCFADRYWIFRVEDQEIIFQINGIGYRVCWNGNADDPVIIKISKFISFAGTQINIIQSCLVVIEQGSKSRIV